jgi:polysaccharide export outer membrane protein
MTGRRFRIIFSLLLLITGLAMQGCISAKKTYYARGMEPGVKEKIDQSNYGALQKIQIGDVLQITVKSIDEKQSAVFNPFSGGGSSGTGSGSGRGTGYLVDKNGQIEMPQVGQVSIAGYSTREAREIVRAEVAKFLKDPWVDVSVISYKVSFLGEVASQGPITILNERLSIMEGIAQAGGLPPTARYNKIWLIREENGERAYHLLNVNDKAIFQSEFYYLRNNDIVYVEPNGTKQFLAANAPYLAALGVVTGILAIVLTFVR